VKTTTTGFEKSKVNTYLNLLKYFNRNDAFARHDYYGYLRVKEIIEKNIGRLTPETRILEIGCGQRFARTMLFHSEGVKITGIDLDFVDTSFSIGSMVNIWRINGFERFIKTIVRHFFYDRKYYTVIEQEYGKPLKWSDLDVRRMSAYNLDFASNYFDFIFSNAVFEHIMHIVEFIFILVFQEGIISNGHIQTNSQVRLFHLGTILGKTDFPPMYI